MEKAENDKLIEIVENLLAKTGFKGRVKFQPSPNPNGLDVIAIDSDDNLNILIGRSGQNLNALEHLVRLLAVKMGGDNLGWRQNFILDINDYRKTKSSQIIDAAKTTAARVVQTQKAEALSPMSSYERRLIHAELATHKEVATESIGQEPRRRVVIKPLLD